MILRQAPAYKYRSLELEKALATVINVVNYNKTRPLKARIFARLHEERSTEHSSLIFFCESRWSSWGMFYKKCSN
jgi:hypothetical protein